MLSRERHPLQVKPSGGERCVSSATVDASLRGLPVTPAAASYPGARASLEAEDVLANTLIASAVVEKRP